MFPRMNPTPHDLAPALRWLLLALLAGVLAGCAVFEPARPYTTEAEARAGAAMLEPFESAAFPYPLYVWPPAAVWGVALTAALACLWWSARGAA